MFTPRRALPLLPIVGPAGQARRRLRRTAFGLLMCLLAPFMPLPADAQEARVDDLPPFHSPASAPVAQPLRIEGPLDLRSAWLAALANDPTLRAAQAGALAGREGVAVARSQWLPQVALSASRQHNDLRTSTRGTAGRTRVSEQPYYSGSQALSLRQSLIQPVQDAAVAQAGAQAEEAESAVLQTRQQLSQTALSLASQSDQAVLRLF